MTSTTIGGRLAAAQERHKDRRWLALAVIGIAQLMIILDASIVNIALPHAQAALQSATPSGSGRSPHTRSTFGGLLLLGGRVADYVGRKRTFLVGLFGFAAASALGGAAQNAAWLFGARALQGVFAAVLAPAVLSLITTTFTEPRERAKAFGVYGAISGAGGAIGLIAGGALTEYLELALDAAGQHADRHRRRDRCRPAAEGEPRRGRPPLRHPGRDVGDLRPGALVYGFTEASLHSWSAAFTVPHHRLRSSLLAGFVAGSRARRTRCCP